MIAIIFNNVSKCVLKRYASLDKTRQHLQIAGNPSRYKILNHVRNFVVAYDNNIRYSKKFYIIGQSAASLLSLL